MKSIDIKIVAQRMHTEGKSFADISEALNITRHSAIHLCNYQPK